MVQTPGGIDIEAHQDSAALIDRDTDFKDLGLADVLVDACKSLGWVHPTQIQKKTIPLGLKKKDVVALAQTGSGKTAAFALPILQALLKETLPLFAVVLAPTRELAFQISDQFRAIGSQLGVVVATIVGGVDHMSQAIFLAKKPHIVVGTPGRILDHLQNTKGFSLSKARFLVLDEADRLLNLEFESAVDKILEHLPKNRVSFLFSATMTSKVSKLKRASLRNPVKVEVDAKYRTVDTLVQNYLFVPEIYKDCYLYHLLIQFSGNSTIVFTSKCVSGQKLALVLRHLNFKAIPLHGKLSQSKRLDALNRFKSGESLVLVATDVASRGLHIPDVDLVINYDIPDSAKGYIHRVGRTARAGKGGRALNLVTQYDVEYFQKIEQYIGEKMRLYPTEEEVVLASAERVAEAQRAAAVEIREFSTKKRKRDE
ncbi:probable ATP-dependent RNA helicase DDX47 [Schistocerca gregaria]|uniref:probable ATP-dependent RNA helicase DDX47 n=1 Tax=Schistocerca gregaria TaxID=7010 RepID=UPI00211DC447|nr:probable ATP-dependent RNA helicase DDX47 [Schistocerca gregaria]